MALTTIQVKNAKSKEKLYKIYDEKGLYLEIPVSGNKRWRLKYRYAGKEKRISLGVFPTVSLKDARNKRDEAKKLLADSIDPSVYRRQGHSQFIETENQHFKKSAEEWFDFKKQSWKDSHATRNWQRIKSYLLPSIGLTPISRITATDILKPLRDLEKQSKYETAHRVLSLCSQILQYCVIKGEIQYNVAHGLSKALVPSPKKHFSAITDPNEVPKLMKAIHSYQGTHTVCSALKLAPLLFVRPGELRQAKWCEIDLEKAEWNFIASKTNEPHTTPLSTQACEILKNLHPYTGNSKYVFPGLRSNDRPMSENAILAALRSLGYSKDQMTGHGFRAMARTILDEELGIRPDFTEKQLAHRVKDPLGRAYNRTKHLRERHEMMQIWSDYLYNLMKK